MGEGDNLLPNHHNKLMRYNVWKYRGCTGLDRGEIESGAIFRKIRFKEWILAMRNVNILETTEHGIKE